MDDNDDTCALIANYLDGINWARVSTEQLGLVRRLGPKCSGVYEAIAMVMLGTSTLRHCCGFSEEQALLTAAACLEHASRTPEGVAKGAAMVEAMERAKKGPVS